ncbi:hypothetical protein ACQKII_11295 [Lysinibacillus sp. NPDC048646]|uniref:hypothetical protein n=1 Tax=Lysinibacillus sp. NPDC048646 TaxID=3390574 RepID=UPI003D08CB93
MIWEKQVAEANVTININNVFALSDWTLVQGRFYTTLQPNMILFLLAISTD